MKKQNIEYVIYNNKDEYIAGFDTLKELSAFLGNTPASMSVMLNFFKNANICEVFKTYIKEENLFECSQKVYCYSTLPKNNSIKKMGIGTYIYKFWEERA